MEKKWTITGAYADWTMTITTVAATKDHEPELPEWQQYNFARLADHFYDLVCMCEHLQETDQGGGWVANALHWHGPVRSTPGRLGDGSTQPGVQVAKAGTVSPDLNHV
jgi:hypothetical protein